MNYKNVIDIPDGTKISFKDIPLDQTIWVNPNNVILDDNNKYFELETTNRYLFETTKSLGLKTKLELFELIIKLTDKINKLSLSQSISERYIQLKKENSADFQELHIDILTLICARYVLLDEIIDIGLTELTES